MYRPRQKLRSPRAYRYVVANDEGLAPYINDGYCTLACCKPMIRRTARPGDWVFGFASKSHAKGDLIYVMLIKEVVPVVAYASEPRYEGRRDQIYALGADGQLTWQRNAFNDHPEAEHWVRDIGGKNVLVATDWWYFGDKYLDLRQFMDEVTIGRWRAWRGHKVNGLLDHDLPTMLAHLPDAAKGRQRAVVEGRSGCGGCADSKPVKRQGTGCHEIK